MFYVRRAKVAKAPLHRRRVAHTIPAANWFWLLNSGSRQGECGVKSARRAQAPRLLTGVSPSTRGYRRIPDENLDWRRFSTSDCDEKLAKDLRNTGMEMGPEQARFFVELLSSPEDRIRYKAQVRELIKARPTK